MTSRGQAATYSISASAELVATNDSNKTAMSLRRSAQRLPLGP